MFRISRKITIGGFQHARGYVEAVTLGGGSPPVIQTMWKERLSFSDLKGKAAEELSSRIDRLKRMGCGLIRFAVPDMDTAEILGNLAAMVSVPLVADIHFDYKIALRCLDFPIAKIRINPGTIGNSRKVEAVLSKASANSRPIRIGVNGGSLPSDLRRQVAEGAIGSIEALVLAAEREIAIFNEHTFKNFLVSIKADSIADTIRANRLFASRSDAPIHVGVTHAGPLIAGVVRNTAALVPLLAEGIGDTIRVSLSDTVEREVIAGREILLAACEGKGNEEPENGRFRKPGVRIISCPLCARNSFDTIRFTETWQPMLYAMDRDISVAIMGCAVNGPEEARHADLGITGAGNKVLIFRRGQLIRTVERDEAEAAFLEELEKEN